MSTDTRKEEEEMFAVPVVTTERALKELRRFENKHRKEPVTPQVAESAAVPRDIAHDLWYQGGRLRIDLKASVELSPENWNVESVMQRLEAWDRAAERYFKHALSGGLPDRAKGR